MTKPINTLTQAELKENLHYNPDAGIFTRIKVSKYNPNPSNKIAGTIMNRGYIHIRVSGILCLAHRLAWLYVHGEFPEDQIDHINHIRNDNRIKNLRSVTNAGNQKNATKRKDNKSGITGVNFQKHSRKWRSRIRVNGKGIHLGCYVNIFDAICARKSAELKYNFHKNHGSIHPAQGQPKANKKKQQFTQ